MKTILAALLFLSSFVASADICFTIFQPGTFPRQNLKIAETYSQILPHQTLGGNAILLAWPVIERGEICCNVSHADIGTWDSMLTSMRSEEAKPISQLAQEFPELPWSRRARDYEWANAACRRAANKMANDGVIEAYRVVRNSSRTDGARPMFELVNGARVPLRVDGVQVYVESGRFCNKEPVIGRTSTGLWLYTINAAGVRGISLCKLQ